MSIADEPDDTPGASRGGNPGGGGAAGAGGAVEGGGGPAADAEPAPAALAHADAYAWAPYLVGFAVLIGYMIFLNRMIGGVRSPQPEWDRYLYLFSSVEALAFAAAGFFFGREVNRGRAQAAESRATAEAKRASQAEKKEADANARGQVLADSLHQLADGAGTEPVARGFGPEGFAPPPAVPAEQLRGLATLADRWFPRR